jgi:tetratricopeptide (TPR) repeat protein
LGHALSYIGEYQKAVECFDEALNLEPKFVSAITNKGFCKGCLGEFLEAEKCFNNALSLNQNQSIVYNFKGLYFFHLRMFRKAVECFDEAIKSGDTSYPLANKGYALISMGWTLEALDAFDLIADVKNIHQIRQLTEIKDPIFTYALIGKGIGLDELQRHDEAMEYFCEAIRLDQTDTGEAYFSMATSKYKQEEYSEALNLFMKVKDSKLIAQKHNGLGLCYFNLGLVDDAENEFRESIKADPKLIEAYYNLGVLYNHEDKKDRAKNLFNTCLLIDKNYSKAKDALKQIEGTQQLSDWYHWWFKSGTAKKILGSVLLSGIIILFSITTITSYGSQTQQPNSTNFPLITPLLTSSGLIGIIQPSNETTSTSTANGDAEESSTSPTTGPNIAALITLLVLLIVILLLPTLRSIKMGTIELTTAPINANPIELKPSTPTSFFSLHMQLHFHMPLKPELGTS